MEIEWLLLSMLEFYILCLEIEILCTVERKTKLFITFLRPPNSMSPTTKHSRRKWKTTLANSKNRKGDSFESNKVMVQCLPNINLIFTNSQL